MRIILINLARATDRREKMVSQFEAFHISYEIMEATDGRQLTSTDRSIIDNRARRAITAYPMTDNEIGCWISHRRAIEMIAKGSDSMGVIVEDDVLISPDFTRVLEALETHEDGRHFDFIFLHRKHKHNEVFAYCRTLIDGYAIGRVGLAHMGCQAYVISRKGAKKFLARGPVFAHAVDKEIHRYWANNLDVYGLEHPIVEHADQGHSYIDETRGHDKPQIREKYPDADKLAWKCRRYLSRLSDSVKKRLYFPFYVHLGKKGLKP